MPSSDDNGAKEDEEEYPKYGVFSEDLFDYEAFFERIRDRNGSVRDSEEFTVRAIQMFCLKVWHDEKPDKWLLYYFADQFMKVLNGGDWCDEFPLPWIPANTIRTRAQQQGMAIYCDIENARRENPKLKMNILMNNMANKYKTSYETVRDNYYKMKKRMEKEN